MWLSALEIGAAHFRCVTEMAPKSPFLCVSRSPIRYSFRAGAKAIRHNIIKYYGYMEILITITQTKVSLVKVTFKIPNDHNFPLQCVRFTPWAFP